ncbi:MAG: LuxR C-terminal-related transcriptional regulator [Pseudonocardiaceae bacterium]
MSEDGIVVVAEADSGPHAAELSRTHLPDVVVMDPALGFDDGLSVLHSILRAAPDGRVLLLANLEDAELALRCLRAGASGYITRDIDPAALPRIVKGLFAGEAAISRKLTSALIERLGDIGTEIGTRPVRSPLIRREWEVLDLLCVELSTDAIAKELFVTEETVRSHVKNILRKLGVSSRAEAVQSAGRMRRPGGRPT